MEEKKINSREAERQAPEAPAAEAAAARKAVDPFDPAVPDGTPIYREDLRACFGVGANEVGRMMSAGKLPQAADCIARRNVWYAGQIRAWFKARSESAARRDAKMSRTGVR